MPKNDPPNQRLSPIPDPRLRRPPRMGGPRRRTVAESMLARRRPKKSVFKKALPYLISGGAIGGSITGTLIISNLFSS